MPSHQPNFITAIDVGSAKTSVLVAEVSENGLRYRGHGISESRGMRKGVITELDKAISSIQKAVEHAEDVAGIPIEHALVGIAGAHIRGMNSHGGITFGARAREIGREEIRQAVDKARTVMVIKRSMNPGFAGIENPLYYEDKTLMLFGDAKGFVGNIVSELGANGSAH